MNPVLEINQNYSIKSMFNSAFVNSFKGLDKYYVGPAYCWVLKKKNRKTEVTGIDFSIGPVTNSEPDSHSTTKRLDHVINWSSAGSTLFQRN